MHLGGIAFIKVGDRVRYIGKIKGRSETWPEGVWLEKGIEGTVTEYHPRIPAPPIPGEEPIEAYAVVEFDNGASTAIEPEDEGERWERVKPRKETNTTKYHDCMEEIAKWFVTHRTKIHIKDMRPIAEKYFKSEEDLTEFYDYLNSPQGGAEFGKILRLEAWKAGIAGPPKES